MFLSFRWTIVKISRGKLCMENFSLSIKCSNIFLGYCVKVRTIEKSISILKFYIVISRLCGHFRVGWIIE